MEPQLFLQIDKGIVRMAYVLRIHHVLFISSNTYLHMYTYCLVIVCVCVLCFLTGVMEIDASDGVEQRSTKTGSLLMYSLAPYHKSR